MANKKSLPQDSPPIIALCWEDANYTTDNTPLRELGSLVKLYEVGFLLKETPTSLVVCSEYQVNQDLYRLALTIPKNAIVWRKTLTL